MSPDITGHATPQVAQPPSASANSASFNLGGYNSGYNSGYQHPITIIQGDSTGVALTNADLLGTAKVN